VIHPEWSKDIVLYEINLRQFTDEGTIKAFEKHLPRLKELGVDVLWFLPVHPIGLKNRKGELGSYYSVRDYQDINPEFGTLEDFKVMVSRAHEMGFYVMLDWVPNHTAWDNPLATEHRSSAQNTERILGKGKGGTGGYPTCSYAGRK
jgi:cyclomaltodextrinase